MANCVETTDMKEEAYPVKYLPDNIRKMISGKKYTTDSIGMSDSQVYMFDDSVLKIEKQRKENDDTVEMMRWLNGRIPVPRVLCYETDEKVQYLLMSRINGRMACDTYYLEHPEELISLLAKAIKLLWSIDISECPRHRGLETELAEAKERVRLGLVDVDDAEPETFGKEGFENAKELLSRLEDNKPEMEPVLSHGDFCLPNIFFDNGDISGFIDLNYTAVADKWKDIALCYRSLKHNIDGSYGGKVYANANPDMLFEKLEIEPDWNKIRYYTLMDELF